MNIALKRTLLSTLVVPFALGVQSVNAAEITEWGYNVDNTLTNAQFNGGGSGGTTVEEDHNLSWGNTDLANTGDRSSVAIEDVSATGGLITNGGYVNGGTFTHTNNIIGASYTTLTSFDLISSLTLNAATPDTGDVQRLDDLTFKTSFIETQNNAGSCFAGSSPKACDDIFTIDNIDELGGSKNVDGWFEIASPSFTIDDYSYTVFLELESLFALGETCEVAGAPSDCVGLQTIEDQENAFQTRFRIASSPVSVPEPGTLALMGLGLAGFALSRRKKVATA
ncbi:PEP-CTERM sorting domain-containing protein [Marinobacter vulgaris]|uniref:PEP-CTERM sorting domain-containing protein n=1 Tax=Marinobacter vulgaris TaxID=1928331 RepID=A0A2V3ZJP8_9GAMM|nr:THxN family PEP-CTERM protein [Marinobacter vulgaris]PXX90743.1 PEP-CTERM sorting domain-containing protein [Marinobacter vulgaris]TSJ70283.1 PEP-CTERM sorting domain-containing protein [Marinobacter vulgaris]